MIPEERRHLHLAALAGAAVKGLDPVAVAEVYDAERGHVAVQVLDSQDRRWLVEEPVSAADGAAEDMTAPLLPLLAGRLPFTIPRPAGSVTVKGVGRITVLPWIEDSRIGLDQVPSGPGLAAAVGQVLAAIHDLDPALYDEAGVPTYDAESWRRRRLSELDRAAATGHVPTGLLTRWEEALELVPLWRFAATPVHGSFDGDSLRVRFDGDDAADGVVTAVTTWQATRVADPADDFAALYDEAHPDTFETVLEAYSNARSERPDRGLQTRARLAAELDIVGALLRAHAAKDSTAIDEIAHELRILDAETADHPLVKRPAPTSPLPATPSPTPSAPRPASPVGAVGAAGRTDTDRAGLREADTQPVPAAAGTDGEPVLMLPVDHHAEGHVVDAGDVLGDDARADGWDGESTEVIEPDGAAAAAALLPDRPVRVPRVTEPAGSHPASPAGSRPAGARPRRLGGTLPDPSEDTIEIPG